MATSIQPKVAKNAHAALVVMRRELSGFFFSPIAYIVSGLFLAFSGFLYFSTFFLVNRAELRDFFGMLPVLLAFFIPALTMRLFAEERRSGTMETLFTMPLSGFDVCLGKFLATLSFVMLMLSPSLVYVISVASLGNLDPGPVIGGYLGALFLASAFIAVGLYASSLTKNQIVAFFIAFAVCMLLALIDRFLVILPASVVGWLDYLSAGRHFDAVSRGILDSRDILYFASLTAFFLALTARVLDERREA